MFGKKKLKYQKVTRRAAQSNHVCPCPGQNEDSCSTFGAVEPLNKSDDARTKRKNNEHASSSGENKLLGPFKKQRGVILIKRKCDQEHQKNLLADVSDSTLNSRTANIITGQKVEPTESEKHIKRMLEAHFIEPENSVADSNTTVGSKKVGVPMSSEDHVVDQIDCSEGGSAVRTTQSQIRENSARNDDIIEEEAHGEGFVIWQTEEGDALISFSKNDTAAREQGDEGGADNQAEAASISVEGICPSEVEHLKAQTRSHSHVSTRSIGWVDRTHSILADEEISCNDEISAVSECTYGPEVNIVADEHPEDKDEDRYEGIAMHAIQKADTFFAGMSNAFDAALGGISGLVSITECGTTSQNGDPLSSQKSPMTVKNRIHCYKRTGN